MLSYRARGLLGTIADLAAIGTLVYAGLRLATGATAEQAVLATFVCALCAVLLAVVMRDDVRYGRRVRESNALPAFAASIRTLSHASHALLHGGEPRTFVAELKQSLVQLAHAFATASGASCVVTVKVVERPEDPRVTTRCRSEDRRPAAGAPDADRVGENSDFRSLIDEGLDHFVCHDLHVARVETNYRNSHFTDDVVRRRAYPYLSTVVWPVRERPPAADEDGQVIGFLCVDSPTPGVFDAPDVALGAAFAHALYSGIDRYRKETGIAT